MRAWVIAFVVVATSVALSPAHAQRKGDPGRPTLPAEKTESPAEKKAREDAYNDALKRIPESKDKYDPWKIAR